jgi:hypothetical protein
MQITDESWREFWRWMMNEIRVLRARANAKYPDHCAHLRRMRRSFQRGMK